MFVLPRSLSVIESRRIACKLELLHHGVRAALFAFEQKRHVNLEFNKLCRLILIATWSSLVQRLETLPRFCVVLLFERNLREIILRFAELWIKLGCCLKCSFGLVKLLLLHQNLATQIEGRWLIRIGLVRFIN